MSLTKDTRASLRNRDNYTGIALSCALWKTIDIWITKKHGDVLWSCDLQKKIIIFKEDHYIVMCTAMLKEMVSNYTEHNSDVYVWLLDPSKSFDRVEYNKLFQLLLDRKLPAIIIWLILDGYITTRKYVLWNSAFY